MRDSPNSTERLADSLGGSFANSLSYNREDSVMNIEPIPYNEILLYIVYVTIAMYFIGWFVISL